jgi:hypothetical protein
MDNGVDLAGEDVAGDDASVAPRQVASSVSQVQEENADEALAGMQERLKADRQVGPIHTTCELHYAMCCGLYCVLHYTVYCTTLSTVNCTTLWAVLHYTMHCTTL